MSDLRKGGGRDRNDRPPRYNKYEEGGAYGRKGRDGDRQRRRDDDRGDRDYYKDGDREGGHRERRDRNGRGKGRRPRDEQYDSRRERPRKEEQPTHDPKLFFNSKKPRDDLKTNFMIPKDKPSNSRGEKEQERQDKPAEHYKPKYDEDRPKPSYEFKERESKYGDNNKKSYGAKDDWADKGRKESEKTGVRQLNPNLLSRPSKPYSNEGGYSKPQGRGNNDGKPRHRKYD